MKKLGPVYVFDYGDTRNCERLKLLMQDVSGQKKTMEVHVQLEPSPAKVPEPILAKATSDPASKTLTVVVTPQAGPPQTFNIDYAAIQQAISRAHPDRE
jgi:hypothetical protein